MFMEEGRERENAFIGGEWHIQAEAAPSRNPALCDRQQFARSQPVPRIGPAPETLARSACPPGRPGGRSPEEKRLRRTRPDRHSRRYASLKTGYCRACPERSVPKCSIGLTRRASSRLMAISSRAIASSAPGVRAGSDACRSRIARRTRSWGCVPARISSAVMFSAPFTGLPCDRIFVWSKMRTGFVTTIRDSRHIRGTHQS